MFTGTILTIFVVKLLKKKSLDKHMDASTAAVEFSKECSKSDCRVHGTPSLKIKRYYYFIELTTFTMFSQRDFPDIFSPDNLFIFSNFKINS